MAHAEILAPVPGTFYRAASPEAPPYKADGDAVAAGETIGLIEVMKTFVPVPATAAGSRIRFLVENEEPVMAGQVIAELSAP